MPGKSRDCFDGCRSANCVYPREEWRDSAGNEIVPEGETLQEMVDDYRKKYYERNEEGMRRLKTFTDFICGEANRHDDPADGKFCKNRHQYRMPSKRVKEARGKLKNTGLEMLDAFAEVYRKVKSATEDVDQFGELASYDFTQRYCYSRGIEPDAVYLHAGTADGYKALVASGEKIPAKRDKILGRYVEREAFPAPLCDLPTLHIEALLCIYHPNLEKLSKEKQ